MNQLHLVAGNNAFQMLCNNKCFHILASLLHFEISYSIREKCSTGRTANFYCDKSYVKISIWFQFYMCQWI